MGVMQRRGAQRQLVRAAGAVRLSAAALAARAVGEQSCERAAPAGLEGAGGHAPHLARLVGRLHLRTQLVHRVGPVGRLGAPARVLGQVVAERVLRVRACCQQRHGRGQQQGSPCARHLTGRPAQPVS